MRLKSLISCSLSLVLWCNSLWAIDSKSSLISQSEAEEIVKNIPSASYTYSELISMIGKYDKKKSNELNEFLNKHPGNGNLPIPKINQSNGKFSTEQDDKEIKFLIFTDGKIIVYKGNDEAVLSETMSIKEMEQELNKKLFLQHHASILNFIIPEAHAIFTEIVVVLFVASMLGLLYQKISETRLSGSVQDYSDLCKKIREQKPKEINFEALSSSVSSLSKLKDDVCEKMIGNKIYRGREFLGHPLKGCHTEIDRILSCFWKKLNQEDTKVQDDSSRSKVKENQEGTKSDGVVHGTSKK